MQRQNENREKGGEGESDRKKESKADEEKAGGRKSDKEAVKECFKGRKE